MLELQDMYMYINNISQSHRDMDKVNHNISCCIAKENNERRIAITIKSDMKPGVQRSILSLYHIIMDRIQTIYLVPGKHREYMYSPGCNLQAL